MRGRPFQSPRPLAGHTGATNHPEHTPPLLVDEREAGRLCGISPRKMHELGKTEAVPRRRIGGRVLYALAELEAWITLGCPTEPGSAERVREAMSKGAL